jgi:anaerobic selenocysteine-containing dehydrogenase
MSERSISGRVSRRDFLFAAAVGTGALAAASLVATPAVASNKMSQRAIQYQATPKGNQRCDNCRFWEGQSSCKLVEGAIAASGWCMLYQKR